MLVGRVEGKCVMMKGVRSACTSLWEVCRKEEVVGDIRNKWKSFKVMGGTDRV